MKNLEYYMSLPYNMEIIPMKDYDNSIYYVARYKELEGLEGVGETPKEAFMDLEEIKEDWFKLSIELGVIIPEPIENTTEESIKLTYRAPKSINFQLEKFSKSEGISKNSAITMLLQKGLYETSFEKISNEFSYGLVSRILSIFFNKTNNTKIVKEEDLHVGIPLNRESYKSPQLTFK
ncbi:type II toxin-antitoxin system HicB family antitoxin [Staphylococcus hominis]|uniref:type II toxin-antitoxin system HicB family antitoxin n=1 Tax=Staphylococcus hominis TaxID=1290 RepID=UPI001D153554|nr:type II toxin-antitoxin system HicB family antitoxin [Staphylococcus hominis]MCC3737451.1 type II toxin-antitoxin system HicB family antitoxin [Staphylococcus hominis]